jgi:acyl-ACP--UDP-N-acetylglucosamine O-acyltransferase
MSADEVKFRKPVVPGDTLFIEVEMTQHKKNVARAKGRCVVKNEVVSERKCFSVSSICEWDKDPSNAVIDPGRALGAGCEIGPYCVIGPDVEIGDGCWLQHHVSLQGPSRLGHGQSILRVLFHRSEDAGFEIHGEPTWLHIGDGNTFREFVTVNRGSAPESITRIGHRGNFLAYTHIAHDCTVGDEVIFSNNGTLAGHVEVGDCASPRRASPRCISSAASAVHRA